MMVSDCEEPLLNCQLILASILVQVESLDLVTMAMCLGDLFTSQTKQRHDNECYASQESRGGENNGRLSFSGASKTRLATTST
jgi:hypothetical protein